MSWKFWRRDDRRDDRPTDPTDPHRLLQQAHAGQPRRGVQDTVPFALTIEDVFTITGRGTVVTGRVAAGTVTKGMTVTLTRAGRTLATPQVTGVEMFRKVTDTASTGDAVGLLLAGVTKDEVARGDQVSG